MTPGDSSASMYFSEKGPVLLWRARGAGVGGEVFSGNLAVLFTMVSDSYYQDKQEFWGAQFLNLRREN